LQYAVARLNGNGTLDLSFGNNGKALIPMNGGDLNDCWDVALQPDGKIVLAGFASQGGIARFGIARLLPNGSLDPDFGPADAGFVTPNAAPSESQPSGAYALAIQEDGSIVVTGYAQLATERFAVMRVLENGQPDVSFGNFGVVTTAFSLGDQVARDVVIQADQRIVVGGYAEIDDNLHFAMARYLPGTFLGTVEWSSLEGSLLVYPNPIVDQVSLSYVLETPARMSLQLTDLNGRVISEVMGETDMHAGEHQQQVQLPAGLASGNYILVFQSPLGRVCVQLTK